MALDVVVLIVVLLGALRGLAQGFLFQLGQLAVAILAFFLARWGGGLVAPHLEHLGASPQASGLLAFLLVFLVIYVVGGIFVSLATRPIRRSDRTLGWLDRSIGALLGTAKAALLVYVAVVALVVVHRTTGKLPLPYDASETGRWVLAHNVLESDAFPRVRATVKLGAVLQRRSAGQLAHDPHMLAILTHPKAAFLSSPDMVDAMKRGDWVTVLGDERVWELLDDPEVQRQLDAIDLGDPHAPPSTPPAEAPDPAAPTAPAAPPTAAPPAAPQKP